MTLTLFLTINKLCLIVHFLNYQKVLMWFLLTGVVQLSQVISATPAVWSVWLI